MQKKIKLLYFIDGFFAGGKERQFIEILRHLDREIYTIGIVTFNKDLFYTETAKALADYFIEIDKTKKLKPFISVWKPINKFKPDIIHTWDYLSSLYVYLPSRIRRIKFINGSIQDVGIEKGWKRLAKNLMLKLADIAMSNSVTGLKNYKVKGEYIYNAIDLSRFKKNNSAAEFNVIKLASFSEYKDYKTFIDAAIALLRQKIADYIYIAGDGPYKEEYQSYVKKTAPELSEKLIFLGAIYNVEDYLCNCRIGVLCSTIKYGEGISNSVLEYMAAGLVPIVTDIGASWEIINHGENGFLIPPESVRDIVEKTQFIKNNPELALKMTDKAFETVSTKFNYSANISKLDKIYRNLIVREK